VRIRFCSVNARQKLSARRRPSSKPRTVLFAAGIEAHSRKLCIRCVLSVLLRPDPTLLRDIKNDAIRVLELVLEILFLSILPEIEEEGAAVGFDALPGFLQIVHLKPEMVGADEGTRVLQARAGLSLVVEQCKIDHAVAELNAGSEFQIVAARELEPEHALLKLRWFLEIAHHQRARKRRTAAVHRGPDRHRRTGQATS
jgi:hypothetical protein